MYQATMGPSSLLWFGLLFLSTSVSTGVEVATESELHVSITEGADISLTANITLTSTVVVPAGISVSISSASGSRFTISGGNSVRIFETGVNSSLTLTDLTISDGTFGTDRRRV